MFNADYFQSFLSWLNLPSETSRDFQGQDYPRDRFWPCLFQDHLQLEDILERFEFAKSCARVGPVLNWIQWVRDRFLIFYFLRSHETVGKIALAAKKDPSEIATLLRQYFLNLNPSERRKIDQIFHLGSVTESCLEISVSGLEKVVDGKVTKSSFPSEDLMAQVEVDLYPEWKKLIKQLEKSYSTRTRLVQRFLPQNRKTILGPFFRETLLSSIVMAFVLMAVFGLNYLAEKELTDRVSSFELNFDWLDRALRFEKPSTEGKIEVAVDFDRIEKTSFSEFQELIPVEGTRFETESEVELLSSDALPKNIESLEDTLSVYEEQRKGGYRDVRYGSFKVFRVLMRAADPDLIKKMMNRLLNEYEIEMAGNVKPGTDMPGGIYYNLFVPAKELKDFLIKVMKFSPATIYENKSRVRNPPGKNRLFLWIKKT